MNEEIYMIKEVHLEWEARREKDAIKHVVIGYIKGLEEAQNFIDNGIEYDVNDCWAIKGTLPQYSKTLLKNLSK